MKASMNASVNANSLIAKASVKAIYFHECFRDSLGESFRENLRGRNLTSSLNAWVEAYLHP